MAVRGARPTGGRARFGDALPAVPPLDAAHRGQAGRPQHLGVQRVGRARTSPHRPPPLDAAHREGGRRRIQRSAPPVDLFTGLDRTTG